jgi:hypothetical protein
MRTLAFLLLVSTSALADDAGILRCRAIKESAARLACYDGLVVPATTGKAAPAPSQATPATQPAARAAQTPEQFGLEYKKPEVVVDAIESTLPGTFDGWGPKANFRLANGQVWQVADDSSGTTRTVENPKVRISRGALGAFYLEIEGTNRSPRVRRLQ